MGISENSILEVTVLTGNTSPMHVLWSPIVNVFIWRNKTTIYWDTPLLLSNEIRQSCYWCPYVQLR